MMCVSRDRDKIKLWHTWEFKQFLCEAVVCALHTPPWTSPGLSDTFGLVMLLRFYLVLRLLKDSNYVYNNTDAWKQSDPNQVIALLPPGGEL